MTEKVSVIMSAYNAEEYIENSINSLLSQTYSNLEIILIDDGSTDGTLNIINKFNDNRIICISRENKGLTKSLNEGIQLATGDYICRQDADDESLPNRIFEQLLFIKNSDSDLVFCQSFDGYTVIPQKHMVNEKITFKKLCFGNILTHGCVFGKSSIFKQYMYDENWKFGQDFELWLRLLKNGHSIKMQYSSLYLLNRHENSISSLKAKEQENFAIEAITKHGGNPFLFIKRDDKKLYKILKKLRKLITC